MSSLTLAQQAHAAGLAIIPVPRGEKGPTLPGWQQKRFAAEELSRHFRADVNIGVLNGEPSGWKVDVDLDHPLAVELADKYLPATGAIFGRESKRRSHWQYIAVGATTRQFKTKEHGMLAELRSTGSQTVWPGSTHPSGEAIEWDTAGEPATVDAAELLACVERLAEAVAQQLGTSLRKPPAASNAKRSTGEVVEMARAYISEEPPAVSGKGGHNTTFHIACELFRFGLNDADAASLLSEYNERCLPPWSQGELSHKLDDARAQVLADGEFGVHLRVVEQGADLDSVAKKLGAKRDAKSGYVFKNIATAAEAVKLMGGKFDVPTASDREVRLFVKDGHLLADMQLFKKTDPDRIQGWTRRTSKWDCGVCEIAQQEEETPVFEVADTIRHVVSEGGANIGWAVRIDHIGWVEQSKDNCKSVLMFKGVPAGNAMALLGGNILNAFQLVDLPFQPEYPMQGKKVWNRFGAQLAYTPVKGEHPHFDMVLRHIGESLDEAVKQSEWCRNRNIRTGADYLLHWAASLFQHPFRLLPYLFFYGNQYSGKSSFHLMLGMLMSRGYAKIDKAFTRTSTFNSEFSGTILGVVEEANLTKNLTDAYNLIKDVTTSPRLSIERKGWDAYEQRNMLHIIQVGNGPLHCPIVEADDTRIVVGKVKDIPIEDRISESVMRSSWEQEAPAFLHTLLNLKLPEPSPEDDRLYLPVLATAAKWETIEGIAKLEQVDVSQRPAAVLAQQIANPIRQLAREGWLVQKTCSDLLKKLIEMGIGSLPENPSQLGHALNLIDYTGYVFNQSRKNDSRLVTVVQDDKWHEMPEPAYSDDELYEDAVRCGSLGF